MMDDDLIPDRNVIYIVSGRINYSADIAAANVKILWFAHLLTHANHIDR